MRFVGSLLDIFAESRIKFKISLEYSIKTKSPKKSNADPAEHDFDARYSAKYSEV